LDDRRRQSRHDVFWSASQATPTTNLAAAPRRIFIAAGGKAVAPAEPARPLLVGVASDAHHQTWRPLRGESSLPPAAKRSRRQSRHDLFWSASQATP
jgi:hypothetical protein